jgi:hypothetical protein
VEGDGGDDGGFDAQACPPVIPEPPSGVVLHSPCDGSVVLGPGFTGHVLLPRHVRPIQAPSPDAESVGDRPD